MNCFTVNLYEHYGFEKPENAEGNLHVCLMPTMPGFTPNRKRPAILVLPGGGYAMTSDREAEPVALRFMEAGYNAFILRYTCAPATFPVALREACMAMRYIRENADQFEVNPAMVSAIGFSAGGHLCGTLGTMYDCPEVADLGDASLLRPDALCLAYAVLVAWGKTHEGSFQKVSGGDDTLRMRLSVDKLVRPDMPPVFLWHTRTDATVPVRNSLLVAEALDAAGIKFAMSIYGSGRHGLSTGDIQVFNWKDFPEFSKRLPLWTDECIAFFEECGFRVTDPEL